MLTWEQINEIPELLFSCSVGTWAEGLVMGLLAILMALRVFWAIQKFDQECHAQYHLHWEEPKMVQRPCCERCVGCLEQRVAF